MTIVAMHPCGQGGRHLHSTAPNSQILKLQATRLPWTGALHMHWGGLIGIGGVAAVAVATTRDEVRHYPVPMSSFKPMTTLDYKE